MEINYLLNLTNLFDFNVMSYVSCLALNDERAMMLMGMCWSSTMTTTPMQFKRRRWKGYLNCKLIFEWLRTIDHFDFFLFFFVWSGWHGRYLSSKEEYWGWKRIRKSRFFDQVERNDNRQTEEAKNSWLIDKLGK